MTTTYHITDIRNVALAGHGASGKTSLADALLFAAGATTARARSTTAPALSTSTTRRNAGISRSTATCGHLAWNGKQVHLIDTPGYPDFIGNALSALAAVENVVLAVSGPSGIEVNTRRVFQEAEPARPGPVHRRHQDGRRERRLPVGPRGDPRDLRHPVRAVQRAGRPGPDASRASST